MKYLLPSLLLGLLACSSDPRPEAATAPALPVPSAPPAASAAEPAANFPELVPGVYEVSDSTVCALAITIERQGRGYTFASGEVRGRLRVEREAERVLLTFEGWQAAEPGRRAHAADSGYIGGEYEPERILLQNYGNSMNEYTLLPNCDAKFLTLEKVR
ncbi:hypothetical protein [Hymenobacter sp. B81]|uniref:hypothetical protein n=1 Tax=Hymenobacter sp. B81 TaxID=3344878 RepID=UPI0037DC19A3